MTFAATILTLYLEILPGPLRLSLAGRALEEQKWSLDTDGHYRGPICLSCASIGEPGMGLFDRVTKPAPDPSAGSLSYVVWIAEEQHGIVHATADMAIDQDLDIVGEDLTDFVEFLEVRFGEWVWTWPWQRFVQLDEGLSFLFPFMLVWQILTWPIRGRFSYPSQFERLELGHIALVLEKGEWVEP